MPEFKEQGIVVKFGADDIELTYSLDRINRALKNLQHEFNLFQKELKGSKNAKETMEILNKQLDNTEEQMKGVKWAIKEYKDELAALQLKQKEGHKLSKEDQRKVLDYERALADAEEHVKSLAERQRILRERLEQLNNPLYRAGVNLKAFGSELQSIGKGLEEVSRNLRALSGAAVAGLAGIYHSASDFESAFIGVQKTVDETDTTKYEDLERTIRKMATELPSSASEIAGVMEMLGQLGIKADDIEKFTKVMIDLGNSTNIDATEGAAQLAQIYNVLGEDFDTVDKFGAALTALGNNSATTEKDILELVQALSGAAAVIGIDSKTLLGLSTTLASTGLTAQRAGGALSTIFTNIDKTISHYNKAKDEYFASPWDKDLKEDYENELQALENWSHVTEMSADEFAKAWKTDINTALKELIHGLGSSVDAGEDLNLLLDDLGVKNIRQTDTMRRLTKAYEKFDTYIDMSNKEWERNGALVEEANRRYGSAESQVAILKNQVTEMGIKLGKDFLPVIKEFVATIKPTVELIGEWAAGNGELITKILLVTAALSPIIGVAGKVTSGLGSLLKVTGTFLELLTVKGMNVLTALTTALGPAGIAGAIAAVMVGLGALGIAWYNANKDGVRLSGELKSMKKQWQSVNAEADKNYKITATQLDQGKYYAKRVDELTAMLKEQNLTEEEQETVKRRIAEYVGTINTILGEEAIAFDTVTGKVSYQGEALDTLMGKYVELAETVRKQAWLDAHQNEYIEAMDKQIEAYSKMLEGEQLVAKKMDEIAKSNGLGGTDKDNLVGYITGGTYDASAIGKLLDDNRRLASSVGNLKLQYENTVGASEKLYNEYSESIGQYEAVSASMDDVNTTLHDVLTSEMDMSSVTGKTAEELQILYDALGNLQQRAMEKGYSSLVDDLAAQRQMILDQIGEVNALKDSVEDTGTAYSSTVPAAEQAFNTNAEHAQEKNAEVSEDIKTTVGGAYDSVQTKGTATFATIKTDAIPKMQSIQTSINNINFDNVLTEARSMLSQLATLFSNANLNLNVAMNTGNTKMNPGTVSNNYSVPQGSGGFGSGGYGDINVATTINVSGNPSMSDVRRWGREIANVVNVELGKRVR